MWLDITELIGKTINKIDRTNDEIIFTCESGESFRMFHSQDCCECVEIDDVIGDLDDLIGVPIIKASEDTSDKNPVGVTRDWHESFTWTFYNIATIKGYVTIRWYGASNGYYSESVNFERL